jgi:hypothetical protein
MLLFGVYFRSVERRSQSALGEAGSDGWAVVDHVLRMADGLLRAVNYPAAAALPSLRIGDGAAFGILAPCISIFFMATAMKQGPGAGQRRPAAFKLLWGEYRSDALFWCFTASSCATAPPTRRATACS